MENESPSELDLALEALAQAKERVRSARIAQKERGAEVAAAARAAEKARQRAVSAGERAEMAEGEHAQRLGFDPERAKEVARNLLAGGFARESGTWVRDEKWVVLTRSGWVGFDGIAQVNLGENDSPIIANDVRMFIG